MKKLFIILVATLALSLPLLGQAQAEEDHAKAMYDAKGNFQGLAKPDGSGGWNVTDKKGAFVLHVDSQGNVYDSKGRRTGQMRAKP